MTRFLRAGAALMAALLACGCASVAFNTPANRPQDAATPVSIASPVDLVGEHVVALSFSGGGLRAAAFSAGVLKALSEIRTPSGADLLDDVTFISSVSGGSLTSAYFALHGREGLPRLLNEVLMGDYERRMRISALSPANLLRLLGGGLNDRSNFADVLDREVFRHATFADLYRHGKPDVWINATDLYHRTSFPFVPPMFDALCSDIRSYPVAEAVAASMAVPLVFAPIVVESFASACSRPLEPFVAPALADPSAPRLLRAMAEAHRNYRDPTRARYIKLVDGGVTDNFGLSSILISRAISQTPYGPLTERDAVNIRRMVFLIVDSGRGPSSDWVLRADGPDGIATAMAATDAAIDAAARLSADSFYASLQRWQEAVINFRCALTPARLAELGRSLPGWDCSDVKFSVDVVSIAHLEPAQRAGVEGIATRLTLPRDQIERAIEGGRHVALESAVLQAYAAGHR
jgi:NTE family protein